MKRKELTMSENFDLITLIKAEYTSSGMDDKAFAEYAKTKFSWADETMNWLQIFTGGPYRDWSIAVEPMTCGPDAFNEGPTHGALRVLAPGHTFVGQWGISGS